MRRFRGAALFRSSRPSSSWGFPFWRLGLTVRRSRPPTAAAELRALVPSHSASCRPPLTPALCLSPRFLLGGFGALRGFACVRFGRFKPFWPPALASQAPPAIILAVLRRFRGSALLRGLCPSSSQGAPFWPSGLTLRSSGLAFSQPLTLAVSLWRIHMPTAQVMPSSITVTQARVAGSLFNRSAGLRLLGSGSHSSCLVTARRLWSHLACAVSPRGCVVFHPAANPAVKLTRQRRAAYFVR